MMNSACCSIPYGSLDHQTHTTADLYRQQALKDLCCPSQFPTFFFYNAGYRWKNVIASLAIFSFSFLSLVMKELSFPCIIDQQYSIHCSIKVYVQPRSVFQLQVGNSQVVRLLLVSGQVHALCLSLLTIDQVMSNPKCLSCHQSEGSSSYGKTCSGSIF